MLLCCQKISPLLTWPRVFREQPLYFNELEIWFACTLPSQTPLCGILLGILLFTFLVFNFFIIAFLLYFSNMFGNALIELRFLWETTSVPYPRQGKVCVYSTLSRSCLWDHTLDVVVIGHFWVNFTTCAVYFFLFI